MVTYTLLECTFRLYLLVIYVVHTHTYILQHNNLCTFRFLVLNTWNGRISFFSVSQATASESIIHDLTSSLSTWEQYNIVGREQIVKSMYFRHSSDDVRILACVILRVPTIHLYTTILQNMDLWNEMYCGKPNHTHVIHVLRDVRVK